MEPRHGQSCEVYETLTSTWMDEGLNHDGQRELLDHLARCPGCRRFYLDARSLEGLMAVTGDGAATEEPSTAVWERIRSRAARPARAFGGLPSWAWRAAAALLLGIGLALAPWPAVRSESPTARQLDVVLEENRGVMTESRFLDLATEILRADRRYHFAMQQVMEQVIDDEWKKEGTTSESVSEDAKRKEGEGNSPRIRA